MKARLVEITNQLEKNAVRNAHLDWLIDERYPVLIDDAEQ